MIKDICLNLTNEDEKVKQITPIYNVYNGQYENQECLFLTEDGLYEVLMLNKIDDEEKELIQIGTLNNAYSAWFLTEDGLYEVLMLKKIDEGEKLVQTLFVSGQNRKVS